MHPMCFFSSGITWHNVYPITNHLKDSGLRIPTFQLTLGPKPFAAKELRAIQVSLKKQLSQVGSVLIR